MKYSFMVAAIALLAVSCQHNMVPSATAFTNAEIKNTNGQTILAGHCSPAILHTAGYKEWYDASFTGYTVDKATVSQISPLLQNKTIEVFLGSWCGDSKRETPRMMKLLEEASFDTSHIKLIFVDNATATYKQSPQHEEKGKNIHHVPTFIVYDGNKELGRIIESPVVSLEKDLQSILTHTPYTPNYKAVAYWLDKIKDRNKAMNKERLEGIAAEIKPLTTSYGEFSGYGHILLAQKDLKEAMNIFLLNSYLFPDKAPVFDHLGEVYIATGNKEEAKKNYQKALQLNAEDATAKRMLIELK